MPSMSWFMYPLYGLSVFFVSGWIFVWFMHITAILNAKLKLHRNNYKELLRISNKEEDEGKDVSDKTQSIFNSHLYNNRKDHSHNNLYDEPEEYLLPSSKTKSSCPGDKNGFSTGVSSTDIIVSSLPCTTSAKSRHHPNQTTQSRSLSSNDKEFTGCSVTMPPTPPLTPASSFTNVLVIPDPLSKESSLTAMASSSPSSYDREDEVVPAVLQVPLEEDHHHLDSFYYSDSNSRTSCSVSSNIAHQNQHHRHHSHVLQSNRSHQHGHNHNKNHSNTHHSRSLSCPSNNTSSSVTSASPSSSNDEATHSVVSRCLSQQPHSPSSSPSTASSFNNCYNLQLSKNQQHHQIQSSLVSCVSKSPSSVFPKTSSFNVSSNNNNNAKCRSLSKSWSLFPGVSIIKPLVGVDPFLPSNLESFFRLSYPLFELLFCIHSHDDPCLEIVRSLQSRYPHIPCKIFMGGIKVGTNPKINNMQPGYTAAQHPLILISDSGIMMKEDTLLDMVSCMTPKVALVHQMPYTCDRRGFPSILEKVYFGTAHARIYLSADFLGINCPTGMSALMRKSVLDSLGGIKAFGSYLAEDYFFAKSMTDRGWRIRISSAPALQNSETPDVESFHIRISRWAKLRFAMVPHTIVLEPLSECLILGLIASWALNFLFQVDPFAVYLFHVLTWFLLDFSLLTIIQNGSLPFSKTDFVAAWSFRELTALLVFLKALWDPDIRWRTGTYRLKWGGIAEEIKPKI